jgi:Domain of unknown function (DUF4386)
MRTGGGDVTSLKKTARVAGLLYFVACIPAPFSLIYIPRTLIVPGDATATANRILASESMFRLGIAGELINAVAFIFVVLALYRLLQGINKGQALLMVTLFVVSVPISFLGVLNEIAALILLRGADFLSVFTRPQLDALAMVFLRLHSYGFVIAAIFWGLWLLPFGLLVYGSGFLPRILGVLLIINCFAYVIPSFTALVLPQYRDAVTRIALPFLLGEAAIALWLLIRGARDQSLALPTA